MADMKAVIWTLAIFSMVLIAGGAFVGDLATNYDTTINNSFIDRYGESGLLGDVADNITEIKGKMESQEVSTLDAIEVVASASLGALKLLLKAPIHFVMIINDSIILLGFPAWVSQGVLGIVVLTITIILLSAVFRHRV